VELEDGTRCKRKFMAKQNLEKHVQKEHAGFYQRYINKDKNPGRPPKQYVN